MAAAKTIGKVIATVGGLTVAAIGVDAAAMGTAALIVASGSAALLVLGGVALIVYAAKKEKKPTGDNAKDGLSRKEN